MTYQPRPDEMMVCYSRVSTSGQTDNGSVDEQIDKAQKLAKGTWIFDIDADGD